MKEIRSRFQGGLTEVKEFKTAMTSLEVAEITGKEHKTIMRDIRLEVSEIGEELGKNIFVPSSYMSLQNKELPMYNLSEMGCRQMGMRWSAKDRFTINVALENKSKPISQLDLIIQSAEALKLVTDRIENLEDKVDNRMGLTGAQASQLGKIIGSRVYIRANALLETKGYYDKANQVKLGVLYQDINKNLKSYYGVSIRSDIPQSKYQEALSRVERWTESFETESKFLKKINWK